MNFTLVHNYKCSDGMASTARTTTKMQTTQSPKTTEASQTTQSNPSKCDKCVPPYYCNGKVDRTVQSPFDMTKYFSCKNGLAGDCSTCPGKSVYVEVCARCMMFDPGK